MRDRIEKRLDAKEKAPKKKVTHTVDGDVYARFQQACGKRPASEVLEALMQEYADGDEKK